MALHVQIDGDEILRTSVVEVPRDRERLEKHLWHDHRAAEIEHYAAAVERQERGREATKVSVAGISDSSAARRGVLMDYLGADGRVHGCRAADRLRREQDRKLGVRQIISRGERATKG